MIKFWSMKNPEFHKIRLEDISIIVGVIVGVLNKTVCLAAARGRSCHLSNQSY